VAAVLTVCGTVGLVIERAAVRDLVLCRVGLGPRTLEPVISSQLRSLVTGAVLSLAVSV
jgi:hypothetical protein